VWTGSVASQWQCSLRLSGPHACKHSLFSVRWTGNGGTSPTRRTFHSFQCDDSSGNNEETKRDSKTQAKKWYRTKTSPIMQTMGGKTRAPFRKHAVPHQERRQITCAASPCLPSKTGLCLPNIHKCHITLFVRAFVRYCCCCCCCRPMFCLALS
jgi:hypothetical protein